MGLNKRLLCPGPTKKPTKEQEERIERAWEVLCEKGSVCITDPEKTVPDIKEILEKDPLAFMRASCDYYNADGMPYDEFVKHVLAGDYGEK